MLVDAASARLYMIEDADRLAAWLLGDEPELESRAPEQHVPLPPVPITIAYLDPQAQMTLASLQ